MARGWFAEFVSSHDRQTDRQPGREDAERTYHEADRDVVSRKANVDRVPPEAVYTANHGEGMLGWRKGCA